MRRIGIVTVARSDYGIYRPLIRRILDDDELNLHLIVSGMHLVEEFGMTISDIEKDGVPIADTISIPYRSDAPESVVESIGVGMIGFARSYTAQRPDILVVLGDRFEMYAAALATLPLGIPMAHIHGGELTEGAIDDALRHSITKISHLHFTGCDEYAKRVIQMGEEPWRVTVSGALGLDNIETISLMERKTFSDRFGISREDPFLLVTLHSETMAPEMTEKNTKTFLDVLNEINMPVLFTLANADPGGRLINEMIRRYVDEHPGSVLVENLGTEGYFSAMSHAAAMVGNSSSGILEAASFRLPVVNIGMRQRGRVRSRNIIDVAMEKDILLDAVGRAVSKDFRDEIADVENLYWRGGAAGIIAETLRNTTIDDTLLIKRFYDLS